jgi:hypothetical protein
MYEYNQFSVPKREDVVTVIEEFFYDEKGQLIRKVVTTTTWANPSTYTPYKPVWYSTGFGTSTAGPEYKTFNKDPETE